MVNASVMENMPRRLMASVERLATMTRDRERKETVREREYKEEGWSAAPGFRVSPRSPVYYVCGAPPRGANYINCGTRQ